MVSGTCVPHSDNPPFSLLFSSCFPNCSNDDHFDMTEQLIDEDAKLFVGNIAYHVRDNTPTPQPDANSRSCRPSPHFTLIVSQPKCTDPRRTVQRSLQSLRHRRRLPRSRCVSTIVTTLPSLSTAPFVSCPLVLPTFHLFTVHQPREHISSPIVPCPSQSSSQAP